MNISSVLFLASLATGTLITITSTTWLGIWIGLEINLLSFIPLISKSRKFSAEAALKYFLTQAFASSLLLVGLLYNYILTDETNLIAQPAIILIGVASMVKMGAAPVHFWFPEVARGLDWLTNIILITWQKIAPFIILLYLNYPIELLAITCALSAIFGAFGGFGATSLRKILAFSSINHIAWIIIRTHYRQFIWITYFTVYCLMTLVIINYFSSNNLNTLRQLSSPSNTNYINIFIVSLNILSIGGLPPFLGFYPKWLVIEFIITENLHILVLLIVIITLIVLYFYLRLTYRCFMFYTRVNKPLTSTANNTNFPLAWAPIAGLLLAPIINFV